MSKTAGSVLVTGGCGFIGSHTAEELVRQGFEVTVLDNLFTGTEKNIRGMGKEANFVKGSVTDGKLLLRECGGKDFVIHLAALRSVFPSLERPLDYHRTNIDGTFNVLEAARRCGVKRVVFASSSSVYGAIERFPAEESFAPVPASPYAVTKLAGESYCRAFGLLYGLETIALRYFNVFGPRQSPKSVYAAVIPLFTLSLLKDRQPTIFGSGEQSRDFTFVQNIVEANLAAMGAGRKACGQVFNVSTGSPVTVNELFGKIAAMLGKDIKPKYAAARPGEPVKTFGSGRKSRELLGFECKHGFDAGLEKTVEWFRQNQGYWS